MSPLPNGFQIRTATQDDIPSLLALYNQYWKTMTGINKFTLEDFNTIFSAPGFDMGSSTRIVTSIQGEAIAAVLVMDLGNPPIHPSVYGCVRSGWEGRGIGSFLIEWAEERAKQAVFRCPDEARVSMYLQTAPTHEKSVQLFEKRGLAPVRYSWFMFRELDEAPPKPYWPAGIQVLTQAEYTDLVAILEATDEAFKDHWGHVDRSGDEERIRRFRHSIENDEDHDPSLWFLAMDGDEIAGVALCAARLGTDRETGVVNTLGVRRPWRRQGLGLALLYHAFSEYFRRGYKRVGLGVDTQNLSGATRLYQKAGMQVDREFVVYEKELRPGVELSKQG
jgi:GNAT superfamily N-acetyltransferase